MNSTLIHSRTQSPSYARSTERDEGLWPFSYPEPFLRAVNGARQGALAKSISNWHLIGYNEGYCSNTGYILLPCFHGIRLWIWPEPLVAPRVRRALGTRMYTDPSTRGPGSFSYPEPFLRAVNRARRGALAKSISNWHLIGYNEGYCSNTGSFSYPEPFLRAVRRGALAKSKTGYHKNMVKEYIRY